MVHKGIGLDAGTTQRQARRHSERTSWGAARRPASASRGLVGGSSGTFIVSSESTNAGETSLRHPGCERVKHAPHHARGATVFVSLINRSAAHSGGTKHVVGEGRGGEPEAPNVLAC